MPRPRPFPRRLLIGSVALGLFLLFDVGLFGLLLFRSLSEREISRVLLETREEAETLAAQLAGKARQQGEDLYLAVATERDTQTYIDSVLRQRDLVRTLEIRDREGRLVYRMQSKESAPQGPELPQVGGAEIGPHYEQRSDERNFTYEIDDLTVPIADFGQIQIGLSQEELAKRVQALRQDLVRQTSVVGAVTLALLLTAYIVIWRLVRRGQALEEQAAEAERMAYIGTLAAGLAHEIRNPLNSLSLNMQMLEEDLDPTARATSTGRLLGITRSEIGRLERLVTDFLAYARPRPLERRRVAAVDLLEHVREVLQGQAAARRAVVRVAEETGRAEVAVDLPQLNQLLLNLAQNALHAAEAAGRAPRITLRARNEGERVALEVEDNGIGIPEEDRERIFEVFYSTQKGGTGLGLPIVRRIARNHGGDIEVDSLPGHGTTMRLWLPRAPGEAEPEAADAAPALEPS